MNLRWSISFIFLFAWSLTMIPVNVQGSTNSILLKDLKHFDMNRHHKINPSGKDLARAYIRDTFTSLGLHTWTEQFKTSQIKTKGVNVVGVMPGRLYKTTNDRPILIGAHYDTVRDTQGVDDNGSGVVAMLQVARKLTQSLSRCTREYSVMFVAFDFEEWEERTKPGWACPKLGCGSRAFVTNFSRYYDLRTDMSIARYGQLQGAVIMDTMMNYNSAPNSQTVPQELEKIFPKQYHRIVVENENRGDFLLATGRYTDDASVLNTFAYYFKIGSEQGNQYKLQVFPLPFDGAASKLSDKDKVLISPFLRSDHVSFWNEVTSNRAIFLSDTANMRSYMKKCYHQECDNLSHVTNDFLGFLSKSCDTIVLTTNDRTMNKCRDKLQAAEDMTALEGGTIGASIILFLTVSAAGLFACCRRRKQDNQDVLVNEDQLEEGRTDVTSQAETRENQPPEA